MQHQIVEIILFLIAIFLAGYLSAAEIAIASFGVQKIDELKERGDKTAPLFDSIKKDANAFFGTIQVVTNLSIITASILAFIIAVQFIQPLMSNSEIDFINQYPRIISAIIAILVVSFLIMIFGILIPKVIGFKYAEGIGKTSIRPLIYLTRLLKFPVEIVTKVSNVLLAPFKERTSFSQTRISEDEIRILISEGLKSGAIDETEHTIIENVLEFNDLRANEVMIPRTEMVAVDFNEDYTQCANEIIKSGHTLIPAFEESADNIIGVIHTKDFFKSYIEQKPVVLKNLVRPAYFVPETKLISEILKEMQKRGERLAIVTDEYGGTEGIITVQDILEEIVGEFADNVEGNKKEFTKLPDGKYYVLGSMTIEDFNESFNINLPDSEEYNTVAGFIADKSGKILNSGEVFRYENLVFELIKKIRQKMVQFKVYAEEGGFAEKTGKK
jgi:putative hemolysin